MLLEKSGFFGGDSFREQNYGKVERDETRKILNVVARRIVTYDTPVYVSEKVKEIKPKALHTIVQNTRDAMRELGIPLTVIPDIIIVSPEELSTAWCSHNSVLKTVRYVPAILDARFCERYYTEMHEMWHLKQAYEAHREGWPDITNKNYKDYFKWLQQKCEKRIKKLGITEENMGDISVYAWRAFQQKRFDEVEAEYEATQRTKALRRKKENRDGS